MPSLTALYTSPTNEAFSLSTSLTAPTTTSAADQTVYLKSLRSAVSTLQDDLNKELTACMDEDNAKASGSGQNIDDAKEEENYGEEVVEEDE